MLLLLNGALINFDNVSVIDIISKDREYIVRIITNNIVEDSYSSLTNKYIIKIFDSKSSAESFIYNDLVKLLDTDKKVIDLRKI
jgi:hypothetical protein